MDDQTANDAATKSGANVVYDDKHNDPSADIVLVSSDNVSFRVSSWYMKQKSGFIRDLLSLPCSGPLDRSPIPIDQEARHIRLFIDMVYSSNDAPFPVDHLEFKPLLSICDRMQADELRSTLWTGFRKTLSNINSLDADTLWEVFGMVATEDDHMACSVIIKALANKLVTIDSICARSPSFYEGIPTRYLVTLLVGNFRNTHTHNKQNGYKMVWWPYLAERFARMKERD